MLGDGIMIAVFLKARAMSPLDNLKNSEHNKNSRLKLTKLLHRIEQG